MAAFLGESTKDKTNQIFKKRASIEFETNNILEKNSFSVTTKIGLSTSGII